MVSGVNTRSLHLADYIPFPLNHLPSHEQSPSIGMTSPNRRSTADLQRLLDGLIGSQGSIRCGDLPDGESEHIGQANM